MVQRRFNPQAAFLGPFLGLNTTTDASELPPQYASVCRNIILSDGRIRPRAPWSLLGSIGENDRPVRGMYYWHKKDFPLDAFVIAVISQGLWRVPVGGGAPTFLMDMPGSRFADMVRWGKFLYVLDGGGRSVKTDGTVEGTLLVGIDRPHPDKVNWLQGSVGGSGIEASVSYKITYYDRDHDIESNPHGSSTFIVSGSGNGVKLIFTRIGTPARQGITHIRIYRRNHSLLQTPNRLLAEVSLAVSGPTVLYDDTARGDTQANEDVDIPLSSVTEGPFAPALNKPPLSMKLGAMHNGRLFFGKGTFAGSDVDGRVFYSVKGFPDYEEETFLDVRGDTDEVIRGMAVVGDQLIIGKRKSIWINTGEVVTATNRDVATGTAPLDSSHRVYRTHTDTGPTGEEGNNMTVAGEPVQVYFASDAGAASFDGVNTRILSDAISKEWRTFVGRRAGGQGLGYSFADDSENGILYFAASVSAGAGSIPGDIQCLAYHYRVNRGDGIGVWSVIDDGDQRINGVGFAVSGVASGLRTQDFDVPARTLGTPPLFGTTTSKVLLARGGDSDAYVPTFEWLSGSMPLARGMAAHVYFVKFFLNRSQPVNGAAPVVRLSVLTDQLERASASPRVNTIDVDTSQRDTVLLSIRRHAKTVRIRIERGPGWTKGWDPHLGVLGWQPDTELVGQR